MEVFASGLGWLLRASWQASILVLLVLLVQGAFGGRLPARWRCALWWLVLLRLLLPFAPVTSLSLFQSEGLRLPAFLTPPESALSGIWLALPWVWLGGWVLVTGRVLWESQRLALALARQRPVTDSAVLNLLEDCKAAVKVHTPLLIVESPRIPCPALHGFLRPRLVVPRGLLRALPPDQLRFVFLHELAHLERHDIAVGWLMAALQAVHWFNPVVWFAFHRMRSDRELAADEAALWRSRPGANRDYGETLLRLLEGFAHPAPKPALVGILEDPGQMRRRIRHIARFGSVRQWKALALLLFLLMAAIGLTDGERETRVPPRAVGAGAPPD